MNQPRNKLSSLKEKASSIGAKLEDYTRSPYVKGLPEWNLFPDDESRRRAAKEIERGMTPRTLKGLLQFLISVAIFLGGPMIVAWLITKWALPSMGFSLGVWRDRLFYGLTLIGYVIMVYAMIRRDMPRALRKKLIDCGVPVCLACGYDLRGLPPDRTCCPECGRRFGVEIERILQSSVSHPSEHG